MDRRSFLKTSAFAGAGLLTSPHFALRANATENNVLRMGYGSEVETLDPIKTVFGSDILCQGLMYSRLLRANPDRSKVGPGLAESWEISDDGLTYTFHLIEAKFSDGSPITADDVAFSWNRMRFQRTPPTTPPSSH